MSESPVKSPLRYYYRNAGSGCAVCIEERADGFFESTYSQKGAIFDIEYFVRLDSAQKCAWAFVANPS